MAIVRKKEPYELNTPLEDDMMKYDEIIQQSKTHDISQLQLKASANYPKYCCGMLHGMLSDKTKANDYMKYLMAIVNDDFKMFIGILTDYINSSYDKFLPTTIVQIIWILEQISSINAKAPIDVIIVSILRNLYPGSINSDTTKYVILRIHKLLNDKISWMPDRMVGIVFLKYLRIITELYKDDTAKFRDDFIEFIHKIWQQRQQDCKKLGRELLRIAIEVSKISALGFIFDELSAIDSVSNDNQYWPMLCAPANDFNIYIQHLIPSRLEDMIMFIFKNVDECNFHRHMTWIVAKYHMDQHNDYEFLAVDLARYIVVNFHPTNEMLGMRTTKRWMMLGWLFTYCHHPLAIANIKVGIFYDWLFYNRANTTIMLIEPGALLIYRSLIKSVQVVELMIDFVLIWAENFDPSHKTQIINNVRAAFLDCQSKSIITIDAIVKSKILKEPIKKRLTEFFEVSKYTVNNEAKDEQPVPLSKQIIEAPTKIKVEIKYNVRLLAESTQQHNKRKQTNRICQLKKHVNTILDIEASQKMQADKSELSLLSEYLMLQHDDEIKCGYTIFTDSSYKFGLISLVEIYGKCKSTEAKICDMVADIINKMHKIDEKIAFKLLLTIMIKQDYELLSTFRQIIPSSYEQEAIVNKGITDLLKNMEFDLVDQFDLFLIAHISDVIVDNVQLLKLIITTITYSTLGRAKMYIAYHPMIISNLIPFLMFVSSCTAYEHMIAWKLISKMISRFKTKDSIISCICSAISNKSIESYEFLEGAFDFILDIINNRGISEMECLYVMEMPTLPDKLYDIITRVRPTSSLINVLNKYCIQNQSKPQKIRKIFEEIVKYEKLIGAKAMHNIISNETLLKPYLKDEMAKQSR